MPFFFGLENRLHPAFRGKDEFGIGVANHFVELQQIDGVGLQAAQRLVDLAGGAFAAAGVELGHQEGFLAVSVTQGFAHTDFAGAVVVVPAVIEEVDAFIERGADDADAFLLVALAPQVVSAQADAGDVLTGVAQGAVGDAVFYFGGPYARQQGAGDGNAGGGFQKFAAGERGLGIGHGRSSLSALSHRQRWKGYEPRRGGRGRPPLRGSWWIEIQRELWAFARDRNFAAVV